MVQQAILRQDPSLEVSAVDAVEPRADRRTVTVLFCDLVDSTKLATDLDPEVYRGVMSRYFEAVRKPIERHGGTVEKFIGDAVLAVFGVPELHEDDALRAVRAATEIQSSLRDGDVPLEARVGVSSGEVHVLSEPGTNLHVSGAPASAASQLQARAPAGGVLLGDETHRLVRDAVQAERMGTAWRLDQVLEGAPGYARRLDAALVGRTSELQRLQAAYRHTREDRKCRVVTLVGEAGIGKTRLAREFVTAVRGEAQVLVGRCVSYGEGATYLPIAEVVRKAAPNTSLAGIRELLEGEEDANVVAGRVAELIGLAESPAAPGEAFWAVRRLLETLARKRTVVVVLDDIHWAEPTLLHLVEYLGEWAEGPILVLCLARAELLEERPGWSGPTSTGFLVHLEALPAKTVGALVEQLAGEPVDPQVREQIVDHAGGNPLFAEQLLALANEAPDVAFDPPASVEALLASRLDRLDSRELAVLRRASVVGRRFSRVELEDVAQGQDVSRHLVALTERGLVHPAQDFFRFHHVLVRDVAYRGIPKSERAELHELTARGLDRRDGADELVGYHFEQAYGYLTQLAKPDDHALRLANAGGERLGRAGIRAWKRADAPAAVNLLSRAVELVPGADELACELGTALRVRDDLDRSREVLLKAAESPEQRLALRAQIELALLRSLSEPNRADALLEVASNALPVLEAAGDDRGLGRAWLCIAQVKGAFFCQYAAMEEASSQAVAHYARSGWSPSSAIGFVTYALYYGPKPADEAVAQCQLLLQAYEGDWASEANIRAWLGGLEAMRGMFEAGREEVRRAETIYSELGLMNAVADHCTRMLAMIDLLEGSTDEAVQRFRAPCELAQQLHQIAVLASRAAELAEALYTAGSYDEAEEWTAVARASAGNDDIDAALVWKPVEARLLARKGAIAEAERIALEALVLAERTDALNRHGETLLALAEVLGAAGREEEALAKARAALDLFERKGNIVSAARARRLLPEHVPPI